MMHRFEMAYKAHINVRTEMLCSPVQERSKSSVTNIGAPFMKQGAAKVDGRGRRDR
jgi:hypothetical protein